MRGILAFDLAAVIFTISGTYGAGEHNEITKILGAPRGLRKPVTLEDLVAAIRASILKNGSPSI